MSLQIDAASNSIQDVATVLKLLEFAAVASAVNDVKITNAATGGGPRLGPNGTDSNIDLNLDVVGTGKVRPGGPILPQAGIMPAWGHATVVANGGTVDANYTLISTEYNCRHLEITGALTAQRNRVLPLIDGAEVVVFNNTTGGFGIQVIGATGTGFVIANAKTAIARCNGTNWIRVTGDA